MFGLSHVSVQAPSTQKSPALHATLFAQVVPQRALSFRSVSQPSSAPVPSSTVQSAKPALQVAAHTPAVQTGADALALLQSRSQAPQWASVVAVSTHSVPHSVSEQVFPGVPALPPSPAAPLAPAAPLRPYQPWTPCHRCRSSRCQLFPRLQVYPPSRRHPPHLWE